ncbi:MAG: RNA methyltransferase [Armatimonadetes bacterium]|nr:RNA methyltransferase [Armatimonadota bacterium]
MIASTRHPLVQTLKRLADHRRPDPDGRILLDGPRLVEAALEAGVPIEAALVADDATSRSQAAAGRLRAAGVRVVEAAPRVVQAVSQVITTQGLVAVARRPRPADAAVLATADLVLLVADRIQDPGNIGTMIRTAVAAGATAVAVTEGTADPFHPKVLRATMGAAFSLPILTLTGAALREALAARGVRVLVAEPAAPLLYTDAPVEPPLAIVVGNEAAGPSPAWAMVGTRVRIPLLGPVESLNVAVAAALLLYEVARRGRAGTVRP